MSTAPTLLAMWSGVQPESSTAAGLADFSKRNAAVSVLEPEHAQCNGFRQTVRGGRKGKRGRARFKKYVKKKNRKRKISTEMHYFPAEDQQLASTYWGATLA